MKALGKNIKNNKLLVLLCTISFLSSTVLPLIGNISNVEAAEFAMSTDFLIQTGLSFYDQGRLLEAMEEFKKALLVDPKSEVAKEFLKQIQKRIFVEAKEEKYRGEPIPRQLVLEKELDEVEASRLSLRGISPAELLLEKEELVKQEVSLESIVPEATIVLDDQIKATQPNTVLEVPKDSTILIQGNNIKRFLNTTPEKITLLRKDQNTILVYAKEQDNGIIHIWDNQGRWTLNIKIGQAKFLRQVFQEAERQTFLQLLSDPFKITYNIDFSSFHTGRRIDDTQRQSLAVSQGVSIRGETPYGVYDSSISMQRLNKKNEINTLTMGLSDAHFWGLEHLNIRTFDFSPNFQAYKFPSADLRGARLDAPMFSGKLHYTTFWGGLPEGNYTRLSPGLGETKEAFLEGVGLSYKLNSNTQYKFYYARTYGDELTQPVLTDKAFGLGSFYKIGRVNFDSEIAYDDADHISYTSNMRLRLSKTNMSIGFTEDDRDFASPLGGQTAGGSTQGRFNISHSLTEDISLSSAFTATRDRRFFNTSDPKRPNYTFNSSASWRLDPVTSLSFNYNRNDTKGSVSPAITESKSLYLTREFFFIKRINSYLNYTNSRDKNFVGSTSNYDRNSLDGGMGFNLIGDLSFNISKSINFIEDRVTKEHANPHTLETSLYYYSRILTSPFYGNLRVSFRDEEETESAVSFLSGEDRLEFQGGLDYRPTPNLSGYLTLRVANIWAEKEGTAKHLDAEVRYGLRMGIDTGIRWNTKGHVNGFVFNDLDGDGVKDKNEPGVGGVTITTSTNMSKVTNEDGYYFIKNIVGKKAIISIDLKSIPFGYTLTTVSHYEIDIKHGATKKLDFGISTRSDIVGVVFVDLDGNNKFDREDEPIGGVVLILDEKEKAVTDKGGQYLFRKLSKGEHILAIDLKSIPPKYIPKTPVKTTIQLKEGETYFYNIPLRITTQ